MNPDARPLPFPLRPWLAGLGLLLAACGGGPDSGAGGGARAEGAGRPAVAGELQPIPTPEWAGLVTGLSEAGGFFDTDNLISNETSYLHVMGAMRRAGAEGGAYIGVGPDQNFAYMAEQRPWLAFIVDLRRDNLVHHLLLKALFHQSGTRLDYLSLLFGKEPPAEPDAWHGATVAELLDEVRRAPGGAGTTQASRALERVRVTVERFGLPLTAADFETLHRFHETFIVEGPELRFTSFGRPARSFYPTFAELMTEHDLEGEQGSYLAEREDFLFLKALQEANRVVPVVGDLAGPSALRAVGREIRRRGLVVRVLYTSNVEYYLWGSGTFPRFAATLADLPMDGQSVLVRSVFPNAAVHPHAVSGYYSTQTLVPLERVRAVVRGSGYRGYQDLVVRDAVDPRPPGG
ncbi:MAG: hypothetical protein RQ751_11845 [Longimicrobiales bacterium]|nr:hypothetical protein [Longimicrobiales bacterium]